jgi:hypothetical protein
MTTAARSTARTAPAVLGYGEGRNLVLSCGMNAWRSALTNQNREPQKSEMPSWISVRPSCKEREGRM